MTNPSELRLTKSLAGAALLLALVAWATAPRNITPSAFRDIGETFFPDFQDPNEAMTLEVIEFDDATAAARPFKVTNRNGLWTIPSHHDYPADGEDRLAQTAAGVIGIVKEDIRSDNVADHAALGVIDPLDETSTTLVGRGKRVTLKGEGETVLAEERRVVQHLLFFVVLDVSSTWDIQGAPSPFEAVVHGSREP